MNIRLLATILVLLVVVYASIVYLGRDKSKTMNTSTTASSTVQNETIESYVRGNISRLSPVTGQLGGTFYVTTIEAHGGVGTVRYEDGHNAYVADFTYSIDAAGKPSVQSFTVRQ